MNLARRVLPLLLILAAPPVMLWAIWVNPVSAGEDDVVYVYPLRQMVGQALREGRWPVNNPLEATGAPLMADPQSAVMFPATWLFAALPGKLAYSLSVFLAFSVAGGGAYLYLRGLGLVRPAATFGAVAFMFCGFMVGHRVHLPMIQTAGFLPWGLWGIERHRPAAAPGATGGAGGGVLPGDCGRALGDPDVHGTRMGGVSAASRPAPGSRRWPWRRPRHCWRRCWPSRRSRPRWAC